MISTGGAELPNGARTPVAYTQVYQVEARDQSQIDAARARLAHTMAPPTQTQAVGWIAELSVITARRMDDDMTESLRAAAYAKRLAEYPADIARHALLVHRWKFFPTWADVADVCDALAMQRRRLSAAIDNAERAMKAKAEEDDRRHLTTEQLAERRANAARIIAEAGLSLRHDG